MYSAEFCTLWSGWPLGLIFLLDADVGGKVDESVFIPLGFDTIKSHIRLRFVIKNTFIHLDFFIPPFHVTFHGFAILYK